MPMTFTSDDHARLLPARSVAVAADQYADDENQKADMRAEHATPRARRWSAVPSSVRRTSTTTTRHLQAGTPWTVTRPVQGVRDQSTRRRPHLPDGTRRPILPNMRTRVLLCSTVVASLCCIPFVSAEDSLGFDASLGVATAAYAGKAGSPGYTGMTTRALGIRYSTTLREHLELEIGATWLETDARPTHCNLPAGCDSGTSGRIRLLTIPVSLRRRLRDHLSVGYGATIDVNASPADLDAITGMEIRSRSGVGLGCDLRVEHGVARRYRIYASPYLTLHSLLALDGRSYYPRVWEVGVRLGVGLRLTTPTQPQP
jgi:hypothetical protein